MCSTKRPTSRLSTPEFEYISPTVVGYQAVRLTLGDRRRLPFDPGQFRMDQRPLRRLARPDRYGGRDQIRIIERPHTRHDELGTRAALGKKLRPTNGAEPAAYLIPAVSSAIEPTDFTGDFEILGVEECIHRWSAGAEILAQPTPAVTRNDRWAPGRKTHRTAQAAPRRRRWGHATASSRPSNNRRPSLPPCSGPIIRSGCGIMPRTLPA